VKSVNEYITTHNLRAGVLVTIDTELAKLLQVQKGTSMAVFTIYGYLNPLFLSRAQALEQCAINMQSLYRGKIGRRNAVLKMLQMLEPDNLLDPEFKTHRLALFGLSETANTMIAPPPTQHSSALLPGK
jgi:hypothetical protein